MKIRVKAEKLVSGGNFNNDRFGAEIEFECEPRNYGELSNRFLSAYKIVNEQVRKQIEMTKTAVEEVNFNDDDDILF